MAANSNLKKDRLEPAALTHGRTGDESGILVMEEAADGERNIQIRNHMNQLAVSLAGHDKGKLYAIVREENGEAFLADGRIRTLENPKKKNLKHIRRILRLPVEAEKAFLEVKQDSDLVHALRLYQRSQGKEKESSLRRNNHPKGMYQKSMIRCAGDRCDGSDTKKSEVNVCPSQM